MENRFETELQKAENRNLRARRRKQVSSLGWALLIYWGIMNMLVAIFVAVDLLRGGSLESVASNGWGYLLTCAVGLVLSLIWKGPGFCGRKVFARGEPMKADSFLTLLSLLMFCQLFYSLLLSWQELLMNSVGGSMVELIESSAIETDSFSMFLYAGIAAPLVEEFLFRGILLRSLEPFGKKLAILGSAFLFAVFHGNFAQAPFAFAAGLVFGYAATEYSILWAMVLHMFNNLILSDALPRLLSGLPDGGAVGIALLILGFSLIAVVQMIRKRHKVAELWQRDPLDGEMTYCFFTAPGVVTFTVVMWVNMVVMVLSAFLV